jgi:N-methylhydantoinase A
MRLAVDTGGTFTDVIVEENGSRRPFKRPTTPRDPVEGVLDVLALAARESGLTREELLGRAELVIYGTTHAINAILTGNVAKTAFLTTEGHPDILLFREGGRTQPFNHRRTYPRGYVPRHLTWQVPERVDFHGNVLRPLDAAAVLEIIAQLRESGVEAVAVCLLWSTVNPAHELRVGALLAEHLPGVAVTLSHALNPTIREYRRGSATAIDASLKPLMERHLAELERRLRAAGLRAPVFVVTSSGGVMEIAEVTAAPIHAIISGPAMAPIAGRAYAQSDAGGETAVVTDAGGTSYDVTLVRRGHIPRTRETWLGERFVGHITGFPSVSVKSIGAGGGSVAWVDDGGLLHVGPQSAGSDPGPACYGRGGDQPTVTDASLLLGYLDPAHFLGGAMDLDVDAARSAVERVLAAPLGLDIPDAAIAVLEIATEQMVHAIEEITVNQGIDPRDAVVVGGGGAAGLNSVAIARRLGCASVVFPIVGAALSAAGALLSDLVREFSATFPTSSSAFAFEDVNRTLDALSDRCAQFLEASGGYDRRGVVEYWAEARYPHQVWELELALRSGRFTDQADVDRLVEDFHQMHRDVFAVNDPDSPVEIIGWHARARVALGERARAEDVVVEPRAEQTRRPAYVPGLGRIDVLVQPLLGLLPGSELVGPAIIEAELTTIVVPPGATCRRSATGGVVVESWDSHEAGAPT